MKGHQFAALLLTATYLIMPPPEVAGLTSR
jgi:hypothetical protein